MTPPQHLAQAQPDAQRAPGRAESGFYLYQPDLWKYELLDFVGWTNSHPMLHSSTE